MKRTLKILAITLFFLGLSACSLLQRHPSSGYYAYPYMESTDPAAENFYSEKIAYERDLALGELGLSGQQSLTENQQQSLQYRVLLRRLEANIQNRKEKRQYYNYKAVLPSDRARIEFLTIPTTEGRERYIRSRGLASVEKVRTEPMIQAIEKKDIVLGMSKEAVQESWGDPDAIEVAGDPIYGNERWKYSKFVSSADGYNLETRIIYFEAGRVTGWERR